MKRRIFQFDNRSKITANVEGVSTQTGTPTPTAPIDVFPLQTDSISGVDVSSWNLHGIGTYKDIYNYTTKKITRKIGKKVFDGTETAFRDISTYKASSAETLFAFKLSDSITMSYSDSITLCSHFMNAYIGWTAVPPNKFGHNNHDIIFGMPTGTTVTTLLTWLAAQYAAGTPVTVYYPLATPVDVDSPSITKLSLGECKKFLIPSEYTQLQYVEADGNQYIDTKITASPNLLKMSLDCQSSIGTGLYAFFGAYSGGLFSAFANTYGLIYFCSSSGIQTNTAIGTDRRSIVLDGINKKFYIDDNETVLPDKTATTSQNLYLLKVNSSSIDSFKGKVYASDIYIGSVLRAKFIPVKNSSNVAGLYDIVSSAFFPSEGTSDFIAGPDATNPDHILINSVIETIN